MAEFTTIETQEELNRIIEERLRREREKYADYEALKADSAALRELKGKKLDEQVTALSGQLQTAQTALSEMQTRAEKAERSLLRSRVAREANLPAELADRLTGDDEAALKADAEALGKLLRPAAPAAPLAEPETGSGGAWGAMSAALK